MRWVGYVAGVRERRGVYRILMRKPEGKRQHGRPTRRWIERFKMDLQDVGWGLYGLD
jgi:hypothetical protein